MGKFARAVTGESLPTRSKLPPITRHAHAFTDYAGIWPRNKISALTEALDSGLRSRAYDFVMQSVGAYQPGKAPDRKVIARAGSPCCSSPAAMCYWAAASLIAWGLLIKPHRYLLEALPGVLSNDNLSGHGGWLRSQLA